LGETDTAQENSNARKRPNNRHKRKHPQHRVPNAEQTADMNQQSETEVIVQKPIKKHNVSSKDKLVANIANPEESDTSSIQGADIIAPQFGKKRRRYRGNRKRKDGVMAAEGSASVEMTKTESSDTSPKKKNWLRRLLD
jgi:hypothetical protein